MIMMYRLTLWNIGLITGQERDKEMEWKKERGERIRKDENFNENFEQLNYIFVFLNLTHIMFKVLFQRSLRKIEYYFSPNISEVVIMLNNTN